MFKIGLENRDFCKSLHFYIVDAGKKKKKKKKKKKNELHLLACSAALGPSGRGHHYFLIVLRGACQRPHCELYIIIYCEFTKVNLFHYYSADLYCSFVPVISLLN